MKCEALACEWKPHTKIKAHYKKKKKILFKYTFVRFYLVWSRAIIFIFIFSFYVTIFMEVFELMLFLLLFCFFLLFYFYCKCRALIIWGFIFFDCGVIGKSIHFIHNISSCTCTPQIVLHITVLYIAYTSIHYQLPHSWEPYFDGGNVLFSRAVKALIQYIYVCCNGLNLME